MTGGSLSHRPRHQSSTPGTSRSSATKPTRRASVITTPLSKVAWVAVKNQFYATILTPLDQPGPDQEPAAKEVWARRIDVPLTEQETAEGATTLHGVDVALGLPALDLKPGETDAFNFQIYAGPKFYSRLERLGHNEQEAMDYGKFKIVSITLLAHAQHVQQVAGQLRAGHHPADHRGQGRPFPASEQGQQVHAAHERAHAAHDGHAGKVQGRPARGSTPRPSSSTRSTASAR